MECGESRLGDGLRFVDGVGQQKCRITGRSNARVSSRWIGKRKSRSRPADQMPGIGIRQAERVRSGRDLRLTEEQRPHPEPIEEPARLVGIEQCVREELLNSE